MLAAAMLSFSFAVAQSARPPLALRTANRNHRRSETAGAWERPAGGKSRASHILSTRARARAET